jgi:hypothetical protein
MKSMKVVAAIGVAVLLVNFAACGGGKYGDVKTVLEKQAAIFEEYGSLIDKATSAKDVAAAMNKFAAGMTELAPQFKAMSEKYPDLGKGEPPAELKGLWEKLQAAAMKMAGAAMKTVQYMQDPEVMAAQQKLSEAMANIK